MKISIKTLIIVVCTTLAGGLLLGWLFFGQVESTEHLHMEISEDRTWTCSMHPQIRTNEPGDCPICGMDLIPVDQEQGEINEMAINMSATAMQLANIQTDRVIRRKPIQQLRLTGKVQVDESTITSQATHISGRIEKLLVNTTGEYVKTGQTIAYIYSPELVTAQKELFEARKIAETNPQLFVAAKEKLKNWKLTNIQIDNILKSGEPTENFPILADRSGIVLTKRVNLGDHVMQGASLYEVANLNRLWILFDIYELDIPWVKVGDEITYSVPSIPGKEFKGKVSFIDPVIDPKTRVAKARIIANNNKLTLKPEMLVSGFLEAVLPIESEAIIVPKSAVMWTGERSVVYVKEISSTGVHFEMRVVLLGSSVGDNYIIEEGLEQGEEIATSGTFSIDAAAQLAGKPSMMNPAGGVAKTSHNHGDTNTESIAFSTSKIKKVDISEEAMLELKILFEDYLMIKDALINDNLKEAQKIAISFQGNLENIKMSIFNGAAHQIWMDNSSKAKKALEHAAHFEDIEEMRVAFLNLSIAMIAMAKSFDPIEEIVYIQHCPMADNNKGADWLSLSSEIRNPYFGSGMLTCGSVKQEIK